MASGSSACAACKFLRRKCTSDCIFAPYFPPDQIQKFIHVHRVYGASNFQKLLAELPVDQRQDAVNSLAYEAETRRLDPVYGCVGPIVYLQHRVKNLRGVLQDAYKELAAYQDAVLQAQQAMGVAGFPAAQPTPTMMHPLGGNPLSSSSSNDPYKMASMMGILTSGSSFEIREPGPHSNNNTFHPQQLFMPTATIGREQQQEIIRAFELQQHGQESSSSSSDPYKMASMMGIPTRGRPLEIREPDPHSNNNNFHPEQLVMPTANVRMEQQQDIIRAYELQQHGQESSSSSSDPYKMASMMGIPTRGRPLEIREPDPHSNNNNFHPEQLVMPTANVRMEQQQDIIRAYELQQHGKDIRFDGGRGFDVGTGSNSGDGVVGFSLCHPGLQGNNNNNTFHPELLVMPTATIGVEQQQDIIRAYELQQHRQDIRFDGARGFDVGTGSSSGVVVVGLSQSYSGPQGNNNNNTFHTEQLVMPTATVGAEQQQEIIRAHELQQHGQDIRFDGGRGFEVGTGSSSGVGVVGFSLSHPGTQGNNNNNTFHTEQLVMPASTIGTEEQQEIIRPYELQQHGWDIRFDGGRGFDVVTGSSSGVGVVGFSLSHPGPQGNNNNNNTFHPEQLVMPTATVGTEQQQEIIRAYELPHHGKDIRFDGGRGFDVGTGSSSGVWASHPGTQGNNNNNTFNPEQLVMPTATVGAEQQQMIIRAHELQQHGQDIRFDGGRGFEVGTGSSSGDGIVGFSLSHPGPQGNNNNNTFHPEQLVMPTATVGTEQQQEIIRAFELQQHGQDIRFNGGRGFDVWTGSSSGVGVVGFSLSHPGPQGNNNNNTFNPELLVMPTTTVGGEQQLEIIRAYEMQQPGQDFRFDGGQGFDVGTESSSRVGVVGFSLSHPGPQRNNINNTFHPEQLVMPTATVGAERKQEIIRAYELLQHERDIRFNAGRGFDVGTGSCSGVGVVGFSLSHPGPQGNNYNNTFHPEQLVMPTATVGTEQQQEIIRAYELQQRGQDIEFNGRQGFDDWDWE